MSVHTPSRLVDMDAGTVQREIFSNDAIFQTELERIFARSWAFVGHVTQIPAPGDYVLSVVGQESVIVTAAFTFPYHGWSSASTAR